MLKACYVRELTRLSRGAGDKEQERCRQQGERLLGHGCLNFFISPAQRPNYMYVDFQTPVSFRNLVQPLSDNWEQRVGGVKTKLNESCFLSDLINKLDYSPIARGYATT